MESGGDYTLISFDAKEYNVNINDIVFVTK